MGKSGPAPQDVARKVTGKSACAKASVGDNWGEMSNEKAEREFSEAVEAKMAELLKDAKPRNWDPAKDMPTAPSRRRYTPPPPSKEALLEQALAGMSPPPFPMNTQSAPPLPPRQFASIDLKPTRWAEEIGKIVFIALALIGLTFVLAWIAGAGPFESEERARQRMLRDLGGAGDPSGSQYL